MDSIDLKDINKLAEEIRNIVKDYNKELNLNYTKYIEKMAKHFKSTFGTSNCNVSETNNSEINILGAYHPSSDIKFRLKFPKDYTGQFLIIEEVNDDDTKVLLEYRFYIKSDSIKIDIDNDLNEILTNKNINTPTQLQANLEVYLEKFNKMKASQKTTFKFFDYNTNLPYTNFSDVLDKTINSKVNNPIRTLVKL